MISLEFSEEVGVGAIWEDLLTTSKLLCSTYLHIRGLKALKFRHLKYTKENMGGGGGGGSMLFWGQRIWQNVRVLMLSTYLDLSVS